MSAIAPSATPELVTEAHSALRSAAPLSRGQLGDDLDRPRAKDYGLGGGAGGFA